MQRRHVAAKRVARTLSPVGAQDAQRGERLTRSVRGRQLQRGAVAATGAGAEMDRDAISRFLSI